MRKIKSVPGEYYHVYNRGVNKQNIFLDQSDYIRFLFCLLYFQSDKTFSNLGYYIAYFKKHKKFNLSKKIISQVILRRKINLINFCLMPNHFHITVLERDKNGISSYMQRVLNSYTKYFNYKYSKTGHLFQGPYQITHVKDNRQLLHLSAYIHKNPKEIKLNTKELVNYFWSSYQDYTLNNRWEDLLKTEIILEQFKNKDDYVAFIKSSVAKENI